MGGAVHPQNACFIPHDFNKNVEWTSAILTTGATIVLLVSLHALSPGFSPSWRVISEYAFGHYAWVLSLIFLSRGIGSCTLVIAIWSQVLFGFLGFAFYSAIFVFPLGPSAYGPGVNIVWPPANRISHVHALGRDLKSASDQVQP
jgi:hypothetical protein